MSFQLAYPKGQSVPRIIEKAVAAGQSWNLGALLIADANDAWAECGADPASIGAVAIAPYGTDTSGFNILGRQEFPPGRVQAITLTAEIQLSCKYVGTLPAANGGSYGVVRDTDGLWKLDFAETTAAQFKLVDRRTTSPENIARVIVVPLVAKIQLL
jgi:hypothetical protein